MAPTKRGQGGPGQGRNRGARQGARDRVVYEGVPVPEEEAARVLCCVDDTDDMTGDTSTGYVAEQIAETVASLGGHVVLGVTRHQLLLAEGVPYTSHNSAMCLEAVLPRGRAGQLRERAVELIARHRAPTSDPGLAVAVLPAGGVAAVSEAPVRELARFGRRAQQKVCTKDEAYGLAERIPWLDLSEHGGTGDGVIGALAGLGLRLEGADGRFRGRWDLPHLTGMTAPTAPCCELVRRIEPLVGGPVAVIDDAGRSLPDTATVALSREAKPVLHRGRLAFVVSSRDGTLVPAAKVDLGAIGNSPQWGRACERFALDNDPEECASGAEPSCHNCLYRRHTARGFACAAGSALHPSVS